MPIRSCKYQTLILEAIAMQSCEKIFSMKEGPKNFRA